MSYCPHCGEEVPSDFQYCNHCGEGLPTEEAAAPESQDGGSDRSDSDTLDVEIAAGLSGRQRTYKTENLTFLKRSILSPTRVAKGIVVALLIGGIGVLVATPQLAGREVLIAGTVLWAVIALGAWRAIQTRGWISIGTTAGTDELVGSDVTTLEEQFLDRTSGPITVSGTAEGLLTSLQYRYHFVPKNIVSVTRIPSLFALWRVIATVASSAFALAAVVGSQDLLLLAAASLVPVGLSLLTRYPELKHHDDHDAAQLSWIVLGFTLVSYWLFEAGIEGALYFNAVAVIFGLGVAVKLLMLPRASVFVRTSGDDELGFTMTSEDVDTLVSEFKD